MTLKNHVLELLVVFGATVCLTAGCLGTVGGPADSDGNVVPDADGAAGSDSVEAGDPGPDDEPPADAGPDVGADPSDAGTDGDGGVDAADGADDGCLDPCPLASGVAYGCRKRFLYGVNWAWKRWCGDFGGITAWGFKGVAADREAFSRDLAAMKAAGVNIVRWWMFPRFLTDSIQWNADDTPAGIAGTLAADIQAALELAEVHDLYLMLTPFSFDNFYPTRDESGIRSRGLRPMIIDADRRQRLLDNLMRPVARAVQSSPHHQRLLAWDMINEPEWAMSGPNPNGGEPFEPNPECEPVTHEQMKTFLDELARLLRAETPEALLTVGGAAIKWGTAWKDVDQDFYSLHYYDWVYQWYPYEQVTPASIGLVGKPVVIGEFPIQGLSAVGGQPARSTAEYLADLWRLGYGGALAWAFNDSAFPWDASALRPFADLHPCQTSY